MRSHTRSTYDVQLSIPVRNLHRHINGEITRRRKAQVKDMSHNRRNTDDTVAEVKFAKRKV